LREVNFGGERGPPCDRRKALRNMLVAAERGRGGASGAQEIGRRSQEADQHERDGNQQESPRKR
jgi:hypothetical protein